MKGVCADHIDIRCKVVRLADEFAELFAIAVLHPPICADKTKFASDSQKAKRLFDERHIDVRAIKNRAVAFPVFAHQHIGDYFLAYIGRIAYGMCKIVVEVAKQKVSLREPCIEQSFGFLLGNALLNHHGVHR